MAWVEVGGGCKAAGAKILGFVELGRAEGLWSGVAFVLLGLVFSRLVCVRLVLFAGRGLGLLAVVARGGVDQVLRVFERIVAWMDLGPFVKGIGLLLGLCRLGLPLFRLVGRELDIQLTCPEFIRLRITSLRGFIRVRVLQWDSDHLSRASGPTEDLSSEVFRLEESHSTADE